MTDPDATSPDDDDRPTQLYRASPLAIPPEDSAPTLATVPEVLPSQTEKAASSVRVLAVEGRRSWGWAWLIASGVVVVGRFWQWVCHCGARIGERWRRPTLSDHLPPLPEADSMESTTVSPRAGRRTGQYEQLLMDVLLAPPEYAYGAILMGRASQNLRKHGEHVFAEGVVHFALSRMRADADGTVLLSRLLAMVDGLSLPKGITPVLLRLEGAGLIEIVTPEGYSSSDVISSQTIRVRMLVVP